MPTGGTVDEVARRHRMRLLGVELAEADTERRLLIRRLLAVNERREELRAELEQLRTGGDPT